ncbi:hypothetical protein SB763_33845, partial [Burkholderia sp. SIMBA_042]|uniref:hypothetical protein n=1 Tax=Burkholderia sp. SIMBA_042 TaxID=3085783 RepID=UPI00397893E7
RWRKKSYADKNLNEIGASHRCVMIAQRSCRHPPRYAHKSLHNLQESDIFRMRFLAGLARKLLRLFLSAPFNGVG